MLQKEELGEALSQETVIYYTYEIGIDLLVDLVTHLKSLVL